jgi:Ankyrin repeat
MYSCACSLSSHPNDLCTVITCECSQDRGWTALLLASEGGHAETVRVLVELGASLEAVDKVHIHAHALANTCCIKAVCGIMRMTMIYLFPSLKSVHLIFCSKVFPNTILGSIKTLY